MRYHFGRCTLDLDTLELSDDTGPVEIEPQTVQVLAYLLHNRHRVVPKTELLDEVWGDRFVSESALTSQIKHCRQAVGDDGRTQAVIRTMHRVGYRFVAEVEEEHSETHAASARTSPAVHSLANSRPLFGREQDITTLARRLADHRLVTVTGVGGVGKSTLVARFLADADVGDHWWCELANTRDPDALGSVVLTAMGEGQQSDADPTESVLRVLQRRDAVLVLDNCEHVANAAADLAADVLGACPGVRVIATSRIPLQVPGELNLPLRPLTVEDSAACFCARALDAGVELDPDDSVVVDLCRRLDGIPLALELAAARARSLTPSQMLELLHHRFRLLADPGGSDEDRQQSLLQTIRWSWDALHQVDRAVLASLSTLVGSFSFEDSAAIGGTGGDLIDFADSLQRLVRASLVSVVSTSGTDRRFRLLETIRDFAAEELVDPDAARAHHARHFADRAQAIDDGVLQSEALDEGLAEMSAVWDNLRAAVGYAVQSGDAHSVRRIIRAVGSYADLYQLFEVLDWCDQADLDLDDESGDGALVADAAAVQARLLAHRGQIERARAMGAKAHARHESHWTLVTLCWGAYYSGDLDLVLTSAAQLRHLSRSEKGIDQASAEGFEAIVAAVQQEPSTDESPVTPERASEGALGAFECMAEGFRVSMTEPERAAELLEAVVGASLANDYRLLLGVSSSVLIQITAPRQPVPDAMRSVHPMLTAYRDRGMWTLILADVAMVAKLLADAGDTDTAARLLGARAASGFNVGLGELIRVSLTDELESADPERFATLAAEGERWSPPEAADVAIAALEHHIDASGAQEPT